MNGAEVLTPVLDVLDILGLAIFALTGALLAAKLKQTFVTLAVFALVTGVSKICYTEGQL